MGLPPPPAPRRAVQWVVAGLIGVAAISIPVRVTRDRADVNLEHRGIGVSSWQDELDGVRYRRAGSTSSVFIPSGHSSCMVPLRTIRPSSEVKVELWLDGRRADEVQVRSRSLARPPASAAAGSGGPALPPVGVSRIGRANRWDTGPDDREGPGAVRMVYPL